MAFSALVISFLGVPQRGAWRLAFDVDVDVDEDADADVRVRVGGLRMRKVDSTRAHTRMREGRREGGRKE
ncbi:hypothetical protein BOTNAR_0683g00050 [Botryotinia narcissicola]|uniref:Uncharacterized protein n=1 Tax=Botryotinia narcissicola TaxID=278944 RepID=A0A4Z1HAL7_9HELO|nr:hypothetical protein BOTNAR_0683g00050 [Botryotinia narcissicola]